MDLNIKVKEKRTGQISFGAGYSTQDSFMIMGQVTESNLFGRGQQVQLRGTLGGKSTRYTLSFTEPWLFDRPISFGVDLYDWEREYIQYNKTAMGGRLRWGFPTPVAYTRFYTVLQVRRSQHHRHRQERLPIRARPGRLAHHQQLKGHRAPRHPRRHLQHHPGLGQQRQRGVGRRCAGRHQRLLQDHRQHRLVYSPCGGKTCPGAARAVGLDGGPLRTANVPIYEKFFLGGINTLRGFSYHSR